MTEPGEQPLEHHALEKPAAQASQSAAALSQRGWPSKNK
jgi:hypothetical protein